MEWARSADQAEAVEDSVQAAADYQKNSQMAAIGNVNNSGSVLWINFVDQLGS